MTPRLKIGSPFLDIKIRTATKRYARKPKGYELTLIANYFRNHSVPNRTNLMSNRFGRNFHPRIQTNQDARCSHRHQNKRLMGILFSQKYIQKDLLTISRASCLTIKSHLSQQYCDHNYDYTRSSYEYQRSPEFWYQVKTRVKANRTEVHADISSDFFIVQEL